MANEELRAQIVRDEGMRLKPYRDTAGKLSIGSGRNLDDVGISSAEAYFMLDNDIAERQESLSRFSWFTKLDPIRQAALVNMAFNLGLPRLLGFYEMIAALEVQDWESAAEEMLDSRWAKQVGARAQRLALQILEGGRLI